MRSINVDVYGVKEQLSFGWLTRRKNIEEEDDPIEQKGRQRDERANSTASDGRRASVYNRLTNV